VGRGAARRGPVNSLPRPQIDACRGKKGDGKGSRGNIKGIEVASQGVPKLGPIMIGWVIRTSERKKSPTDLQRRKKLQEIVGKCNAARKLQSKRQKKNVGPPQEGRTAWKKSKART